MVKHQIAEEFDEKSTHTLRFCLKKELDHSVSAIFALTRINIKGPAISHEKRTEIMYWKIGKIMLHFLIERMMNGFEAGEKPTNDRHRAIWQ